MRTTTVGPPARRSALGLAGLVTGALGLAAAPAALVRTCSAQTRS
jgi:hypothetical protein